jgi:hypothetical protein
MPLQMTRRLLMFGVIEMMEFLFGDRQFNSIGNDEFLTLDAFPHFMIEYLIMLNEHLETSVFPSATGAFMPVPSVKKRAIHCSLRSQTLPTRRKSADCAQKHCSLFIVHLPPPEELPSNSQKTAIILLLYRFSAFLHSKDAQASVWGSPSKSSNLYFSPVIPPFYTCFRCFTKQTYRGLRPMSEGFRMYFTPFTR